MLVTDYGLHDSDVVFIEINHNDEWIFDLDMNNPKYFGPKNVTAVTELDPPNYHRYWEIVNHRSFSTVDCKTFPLPEYAKILQCMEYQKPDPQPDPMPVAEPDLAASMICEEKIMPVEPEPMISLAASAEPNVEFNGTSEANATNETSDGVELNKDIDGIAAGAGVVHTPIKVPIEETIENDACDDMMIMEQQVETVAEPLVVDTKVKLRLTNIQLPPTKAATTTTVRIVRPKKAKKRPASLSREESPIPDVEKIDGTLQISPMRRHQGKPSGIQNIGNTCYLSSSIQCLKHTSPLFSYLSTDSFEPTLNPASSGEIIKAFAKLLRALTSEGLSISPYQFKRTIDKHTTQFPLNKQCDAHEFVSFLIDKLHDETMEGEDSPIHKTFYGKFRSRVKCLECQNESITQEPFMCISLPVDGVADELTLLLHTQSQHLFSLTIKFDDEGITIGTLKAKIKEKMIVNELDLYLLVEGGMVELLSDATSLGTMLGMEKAWELYAIEKGPTEPKAESMLVKLEIGKSSNNQPILLNYPKELINSPEEFKIALKRLVAGPFATESELSSSQYNFTLSQQAVYTTPAGLSYIGVELRASSRNSHFVDLISKLPHQEIEILRHSSEGDFSTLEGCLKSFTGIEKLHGTNQWSCEGCHKFTDAHKRLEYLQLPQILIIHLKRFKVRCKRSRMKISKLVKFPPALPLATVESGVQTRYNLYGIINHVGEIERGHYTAYCKEEAGWMQFDDNKVTVLDPTMLETANAYVLFYERVEG